jgi:hypothetical protein
LMRHRAYIGILALGRPVTPLVLDRLQSGRGMRPIWLRLLGSLTHVPPGAGEETIDAATAAWISWGKSGVR